MYTNSEHTVMCALHVYMHHTSVESSLHVLCVYTVSFYKLTYMYMHLTCTVYLYITHVCVCLHKYVDLQTCGFGGC